MGVTRSGSIDPALDARSPCHAEALEEEADGYSCERGKGNIGAPEGRVEEFCHEGEEDEDGDGIDDGKDVIGHAVGFHFPRLGDGVGGHLGLAEPVYDEWGAAGKGGEYVGWFSLDREGSCLQCSTSNESRLQLFDEAVGPTNILAVSEKYGVWLRGIHLEAVPHCNPESFESWRDDTSLRFLVDCSRVSVTSQRSQRHN